MKETTANSLPGTTSPPNPALPEELSARVPLSCPSAYGRLGVGLPVSCSRELPDVSRLGTGCEVQCPELAASGLCRSPFPTLPLSAECLSAGRRTPWRRLRPRPAVSFAGPGVLSPESLLPVPWLRIPKALWRTGSCVHMSQTPGPRNPDGTASGSCLPKSKKPRVCGEGCSGDARSLCDPSVRSLP